MHSPIRVLFVCDRNAARSQMAEGLLKSEDQTGFEVHSASLTPEAPHALAVEVMREIDIDISGQVSHHLNDFEEIQFDYVITLCEQARESCLAFPRDGHNLRWQSDDPAEAHGSSEEVLAAFRRGAGSIAAEDRAVAVRGASSCRVRWRRNAALRPHPAGEALQHRPSLC